jgi:hypothetical protein
MRTIIFFAIAVPLAWAARWWFVARNRPAMPPLAIADNDPLMLEAIQKARDSIPQLRELFEDAKEFTNVNMDPHSYVAFLSRHRPKK